MHGFKLNEKFLDEYKSKQPKFGPLGLTTYVRTYSRVKEDGTNEQFWETVKRVVEGVYAIQKDHCKNLGVEWNNEKAQFSAQEMYRRIWDFKFLPPGRGLWMMGSEAVERSAAGLFNCSFVSTQDLHVDLAEPFTWAMEMLMLGCIAKGGSILTDKGPYKIEDLVGKPFNAIVNGKAYLAPKGSWSTGTKDVVKLTTKTGREVTLTKDHKLQKVVFSRKSNITYEDIVWTDVDSLVPGDKIKLGDNRGLKWEGEGTYAEGYLSGLVMSDGWFESHIAVAATHDKDAGHEGIHDHALEAVNLVERYSHAQGWRPSSSHPRSCLTVGNWVERFIDKKPKVLRDCIENTSSDFHEGFLRGMFDGDGSVHVGSVKRDYKVSFCQANLRTIQIMQRMLSRLGVQSSIRVKRKDRTVDQINGRTFTSNPAWNLYITGQDIITFGERVGFAHTAKAEKLSKIVHRDVVKCITQKRFAEEILSIEPAGNIEVFDISVPEVTSFEVNGIIAHNCGVGFDAKGAGNCKILAPRLGTQSFVVEDSREGWVDALRATIFPFTGKGFLPPSYDYSKVRPAGQPIKGFGGIASGPGPLDELLQEVKIILTNLVDKDITVTAINDIMNLIGRCVVSGNVRRSAELSLGEATDKEFLNLKNPEINSERLMHHGWASNNSVYAGQGMDYSDVALMTAKNGEPGYVWLDTCRKYGRLKDAPTNRDYRVMGVNPCAEITLDSYEMCNICETFPANHESLADYKKTLKYAYLYCKTVTLLKTHSARTNAVIQRNRRVGVSMSGIVQAVNKFGRRKFFEMCDSSYDCLNQLDKLYSDWLCIPRSVKLSTVKPSGSVSLLTGSTPGIHFPHSEYYIRRIRFQASSPMVPIFEKNGYKVELDAYSPNTVCVEFPVKEEYYSRGKADVTMWEQLELAAAMQYYWADNSVSITVTVKPEESKDIKYALELYESRLKTVSFLPLEDHKYVQAPYETITKEQYEEMSSRITPVTSFDTAATHEVTEVFCSNDVCEIRPKSN